LLIAFITTFFISYPLPIAYFDSYLAKHSFRPKIEKIPQKDLSISVVIPCFNEPDVITSLQTLCNCERPKSAAEVILIMNYPEGSDESIRKFHADSIESVYQWQSEQKSWLSCHIIDAPSLPIKFAGVGLARKIGMDEAIYRFSLNQNEAGIICGFDADALVDKNYFISIEEHFRNFPKTQGASI
jgi:cellulose synthase/poly-beta-1,6-N-acetylglucosamine synthase-like glycosyltransferase